MAVIGNKTAVKSAKYLESLRSDWRGGGVVAAIMDAAWAQVIVSGLVGFTQCGLIMVGLWQMRISSNERNRQLDRQDTVMEQQGKALEQQITMSQQQGKALEQQITMSQQHGKALEQHGKALEQQGKVLEQQITMLQRQDTVMERQDKALERQGKALESASLGILELLKRSA